MASPNFPNPFNIGGGFTNPSRWVDIQDALYEIVPLKKPLFHMVGDGEPPKDRFHQWMRRTYTVRGRNAAAIGDVFTFSDQNKLPTLDQFNYVQIFTKYIRVTDMEQATKHYAIDNLFNDQVETELGILGTEIETAMWRESLDSIALGNMTTPRMQGILMAILCGVSTYTDLNSGVFTETVLNATLARLWQDFGSEPQDGWIGARAQNVVSTFNGGNTQTRFIEADRTTAIFSIVEYQSAFQPIHFHLSRDIPSGNSSVGGATLPALSSVGCSLVLLDHSMIQKHWLEQLMMERAPRTALSQDAVAHCMLTESWGHPHAHYWIANMSCP